MATPTVYVICDQNCKFEGMTKEQILTAITQAVNEGTIGNIDTGFVTTIKTINGTPLKFFVGEQSEYNALTAEDKKDLFAIITNDTTKDALFKALDILQTEVTDVKDKMLGLQTGAFVVKRAQEIIPTDITADDIKPTRTGLYVITLANPAATVLLSITDLDKHTSASVEVECGEYPTVPILKTYVVEYLYGEINLCTYAFIRSETKTFEKIEQDNSIESCYLILPYGEGSATPEPTKYYSITTNLTNCYGTNTETSIIDGGTYGNSIYTNTGYENQTITVTMGGVDVTESYVSCDGSYSFILISGVTGDIVITATATKIEDDTTEEVTTYTVTNNLTSCANSNTATTIEGATAYSGTITANSGCTLDSVIITMGGVDITSTAYSNGAINIGSVTGNVVITAVATVIEEETTEGIEAVELPEEYQQVAYIETDGNQYIDTGIYPSQFNDTMMYANFIGKRNDKNTSNADEYLYGCKDYSEDVANSIGNARFCHTDSNIYLEVGQADNAATYTPIPSIGEKFTIKTESYVTVVPWSRIYVNDVTGDNLLTNDLRGVGVWNNYTIYLLWCNRASDGVMPFCGKLYGFTLHSDEELVYNLVPCYRKSDNVIGLYDTIRGLFFTNSGTGTFTKGAEIH